MTRKLLSLAIFLFAVGPAFGSFTFTLDSSTLSGAPGDEVFFTGTLTSDTDVFLNSFCTTFSTPCDENNSPSPAFLTLDNNVFFNNVPGSLDGFTSLTYSGPIFGILIDPSAPLGLYMGNASVLGGPQTDPPGTVFNPLGSIDFQVVVATPEPATLGLLATALVLFGWALVSRRSTGTNLLGARKSSNPPRT